MLLLLWCQVGLLIDILFQEWCQIGIWVTEPLVDSIVLPVLQCGRGIRLARLFAYAASVDVVIAVDAVDVVAAVVDVVADAAVGSAFATTAAVDAGAAALGLAG